MVRRFSESPRPILLTGLPRTGTTWSSRAISAATKGRLIHEPFNWKDHPDRVDFHMQYVSACSDNTEILNILREAMSPSIPFLARFTRDRQIIIKDVHICLAIEYIWAILRPHIIILVRHPCAVARSWANLGLKVHFRLELLLSQEKLLKDHLSPFAYHIRSKKNYFFEIGAYWAASYFVLRRLTEGHPDWQWVTHESLCAQPIERFEQVLESLGIELSRAGRNALQSFVQKNDRPRRSWEGPYSLARVSSREAQKWKSNLTTDQIKSVIDGAEPFGILSDFYDK